MHNKTKLIFITGWGRSGSTILGRVLGQVNGFWMAGELRYICLAWTSNRLCGCGVPFRECKTWENILGRLFGGVENINASEIIYRYKHRRLLKSVPLLAIPGGKHIISGSMENYVGNLDKLYQSIISCNKCKVIIDTTKYPNYGYVLKKIPSIEMYIIHLIRDPRAVSYSWQRSKLLDPHKGVFFKTRNHLSSALTWLDQNLRAEILGKLFPQNYLKLKYEDFVQEPEKTFSSILNLVGEKTTQSPFKNGHTIYLKTDHSVAGNPVRFKSGTVDLFLDEEWKKSMTAREKKIVTSITWPLLNRYGYKIRS